MRSPLPMLKISPVQMCYRPLDTLAVQAGQAGVISLRDAVGVEYAAVHAQAGQPVQLVISGALGWHQIVWRSRNGAATETIPLRVSCATAIEDDEGFWQRFHNKLYWNIHRSERTNGEFEFVRFRGNTYALYSCWLRDNVHVIQGKKWYARRLKDALDLYAESQAPDGMVFDFYMDNPGPGAEDRFADRRFIAVSAADGKFWERVPVENDVEYLFVQGIWETWKASGDDDWMRGKLDHAERALTYNLTCPYCWSSKYQLLKRALTIDTWDFTPRDQAALVGGDVMEVKLDRTRFGIFHGDNTGFAQSCRLLAEMYDHVGNEAHAKRWRDLARQILARLDAVAWNGNFYTHWVPEDGQYSTAYDVDMRAQVSLSNTYALNRGIDLDKSRAITATYRQLKETLDPTAPAEFYGIYPPFVHGFHFKTWHYVNGGVWPFVGGQLARGAFDNGNAAYGVDILRRLDTLLEKHDDQFPYYWVGRKSRAPERSFAPVDLQPLLNADTSGEGAPGVVGWEGQGTQNDFAIMPTGNLDYFGVPFQVIDPHSNGRRACIGLAADARYQQTVTMPINRKAASLYFLHNLAGQGNLAGWVDISYADGSHIRQFVERGKHIGNWWHPLDVPYNRVEGWRCRVAFVGQNRQTTVGNYIWGFDNPHPDREIAAITLTHSGLSNHWFVFALTLCDRPVWFEEADQCNGWFYNWNTSGVVYGLMEGLCGVRNTGVAMDRVLLAPCWAAAQTKQVKVFAHLPESDGYVAYEYAADADSVHFTAASGARCLAFRVLLPVDQTAASLQVNGQPAPLHIDTVAGSRYVTADVSGPGPHRLDIVLKPLSRDQ